MPKQIKLKAVLDSMVKASMSRTRALMTFTQSDALLFWGLFQGIDMTLRLLFTRKELSDLASRHRKELENHIWLSMDGVNGMDKELEGMRLNLANEGMDAAKQYKRFEEGNDMRKEVVNLVTDLLRQWEPKK